MMKSFSDILNNKNISSPLVRGVRAAQVIDVAKKVLTEEFGASIKEHVNPAYFKNQTLTIACLSSTAAQELRLREQSLLNKLNDRLRGVVVSRIRYLS
jgi:predicted nucleic acid-binding Zn ribbon protein